MAVDYTCVDDCQWKIRKTKNKKKIKIIIENRGFSYKDSIGIYLQVR